MVLENSGTKAESVTRTTEAAKRELRLEVCQRALKLVERPDVTVTSKMYAYKSPVSQILHVCILGGLIHEALAHDLLGNVPYGAITFSVGASRCNFYRQDNFAFVLDVLSELWEVEDAALIECAFEGDVSLFLGRKIRVLENTKRSTTLYDFFNCGMTEDLTTLADRNLVGQFSYARTLRQYVPDDTERYCHILRNVIEHGGLYNPRGH